MSNTFGKKLTLTTFGSSHGEAVGGVVDGFPRGIAIDFDKVRRETARRKTGVLPFSSQRNEDDEAVFISGIECGVSTGFPIAFFIKNKNARSGDYDKIREVFRPSHSDFTYHKKYGITDFAGGMRASGRETVSWVVAGSLAKQVVIVAETEEEARRIAEEKEAAVTGGMRLSTLYFRRFMRNKPAVAGSAIFVFLVLLVFVGPRLTKWDYEDLDRYNIQTPPSPEHWFGTSGAGNDMFAQVVHGLGRSLTIALTVSIATTAISAFIGSIAAFLGGRAERAILAVIHFMLIIPSFLLVALLVAGSGGDWKVLTVVLIVIGWMYPARIVWSLAISIREREYVKAARFMGVSGPRIVIRHIIPNIGSLLIVNATLGVVTTVMSETGLSFLGLGVKLPDISLGNLLTTGANSVRTAAWTFWAPAITLVLLTVSMALIADGLRDALDPNSSAGGRA